MARRRRSEKTPASTAPDLHLDPGNQHNQPQPVSSFTEKDLLCTARRLTTAASKPEDFHQKNDTIAKELTGVLRDIFALARRSEVQSKPFGPLGELYVEGIDCESIWAELELRNAALDKYARRTITRLRQSKDTSLAADIEPKDDASEDGAELLHSSPANSEGLAKRPKNESYDYSKEVVNEARRRNGDNEPHASDVIRATKDEDAFFDADDMENFADQGTHDDELDDGVLDEMYGDGDASVDSGMSEGMESGSDSDLEKDVEMNHGDQETDENVGGVIQYTDFYEPDGLSSTCEKFEKDGGMYNAVQDIHEVERSEDEQQQTTHAIVAKRMKSRITDQEQELVAEKPWALRGEVHSGNRPQNSLLEATVDVDRATRVAPLPTPERAVSLLEMIKKRCLDENWNDVTPRNVQGPTVRKEAPELSQEKSKEGLGALYEKEFLKKTMGVDEGDPKAAFKTELKQLFAKLCGKLDALCNFHYTPKAVVPEIKVHADVAAIAMEEVLPASVADADALAPEEVYAKKRGRDAEFLEAGEMDQVDRKRVRLSKKARRRKAKRQMETEQKLVSKLNPGLGNKYEKSKMLRDIQSSKNVTSVTGETSTGKEFSTSSKFFTQLQKTVKATVTSVGQGAVGEGDAGCEQRQAAQLRL